RQAPADPHGESLRTLRPPGEGRRHGGNAVQGSSSLQQQQPDAGRDAGTDQGNPGKSEKIPYVPRQSILIETVDGRWQPRLPQWSNCHPERSEGSAFAND